MPDGLRLLPIRTCKTADSAVSKSIALLHSPITARHSRNQIGTTETQRARRNILFFPAERAAGKRISGRLHSRGVSVQPNTWVNPQSRSVRCFDRSSLDRSKQLRGLRVSVVQFTCLFRQINYLQRKSSQKNKKLSVSITEDTRHKPTIAKRASAPSALQED